MGRKTRFIEALGFSWRRGAAGVVFGLGLVALGWGLYQLIGGWGYRSARDTLAANASEGAQTVSGALETTRTKVKQTADSARLREALAQHSARARRRAADELAPLFPDALRIRVFSPDVEQLDAAPFPEPGFSALSLLLAAKESGQTPSPAIVAGSASNPRVNFVAPVLERLEESFVLRGFLLVTQPLEAVDTSLRALDVGDAYLDLRAPWQDRTATVMSYGGYGRLVLDENLSTVAVIGSRFEVGHYVPKPFAILDLPLLAVWGTVIASLAALGGGFMLRREPKQPVNEWTGDQTLNELEQARVDEALQKTMDFANQAQSVAEVASADEISASIFRAYDIRGVVDETLTPAVTRTIGQAIGSEAIDRELSEIVVGRDGRLSSPELSAALIEGIRNTGINVIDIGAVPTGVLYYATHTLETGSGVMVTGSHNPPNYNGFKIMLGGETLAAEQITALYERIVEGRLASGSGGIQDVQLGEEYVDRIASDVQVVEPLKVVVDAGNGIAGELAPQVLEEIGCEVVTLHCDVDGEFPNHHPDPSDPANLEDLIAMVAESEADLGVAFDGDGDRLGVVTSQGEMIYPDRLLILFARDVLMRNPGANVIFDVKCTGHLSSEIVTAGGSPIMWKTGHSLIKAKMKEVGAELAGEMSGHFFFKERWYGFDDGIYAAARLLEILAAEPDGPETALAELPNSMSTPELKVEMDEGEHFAFVEQFAERAEFPDARVNKIDGLRADFADGWGLVRCSNTTPCLVMRFDADSEASLDRIKEAFRMQLMRIKADLPLPF